MVSIFLMYVCEDGIIPELSWAEKCGSRDPRIKLMWIGSSTSVNLNNIIYDKRSIYTKCKNQSRYYSEFMELFKYIDTHDYFTNLRIGLKCLETDIPSQEILTNRITSHLTVHRIFYGDRLVLCNEYRNLLELKLNESVSRLVHAPDVTAEDRKKISSKKYTDTHREALNAKSQRYYARNKDRLKAARDALKDLKV